jgi:hypothetical protein
LQTVGGGLANKRVCGSALLANMPARGPMLLDLAACYSPHNTMIDRLLLYSIA